MAGAVMEKEIAGRGLGSALPERNDVELVSVTALRPKMAMGMTADFADSRGLKDFAKCLDRTNGSPIG
jgi:hypothetical protein